MIIYGTYKSFFYEINKNLEGEQGAYGRYTYC